MSGRSGPRFEGGERIRQAIERAGGAGHPAVAAFLTGGFPDREAFPTLLASAMTAADLIEVGVPFSDPMADGLTIQRSSRVALEHGTTLPWMLETIGRASDPAAPPVLLMSYLNPLLAHGLDRFAEDASRSRVAGVIVPDLPLEEAGELRHALDGAGVALVQLVTPATPPDRLRKICRASRGFVYAVTMRGTTGAAVDAGAASSYLARVREVSPLPVLAGFGVRTSGDVQRLTGSADGVIVGSALVEAIERGLDPAAFLRSLREQEVGA